jgi:hypothetical protein
MCTIYRLSPNAHPEADTLSLASDFLFKLIIFCLPFMVKDMMAV